MGRTNYNKYDPRTDSTPGVTHPFNPDKTVVLQVVEKGCPCGCGQTAMSRGRTFAMGHDARYRGKLIRAHVAGAGVAQVTLDEKGEIVAALERTPMELAERHGWERYLEEASEREENRLKLRRERANRDLTAKAIGPQIGDRKLIKVGRWE